MKIIKGDKLYDFVKLGDISKISTGATPSTKEKIFWENGDINWMSSGEVNKGIIKFIDKKITKEGLSSISGKFFEIGTIMMALAGQGKTKGMVGLTEVPTSCNQSLAAIQLIQNRIPFLYYKQLQLIYKKIRALVGEGREGLNIKIVKDINVRDIPLNEQYKIHYVLYSQENLIENIKQLIKKIEIRNQYYAEKILSGELRVRKNENGYIEFYNNTEWQDVILNGNSIKIPLLWKVKKITEIIKTKKGSSIKSDLLNYIGNGIQYLRTNEVWDDSSVNKDKIYFDGETTSFTVKDKSEYIICFDGFNTKPHIGTVGMVTNNGEGICSGELHKIQEIDGISKYYVNVMILKNSRFQDLICRSAEGSTVKHAGKHFKNIEEILIPMDEQELLNDIFKNQLHEIDSLKSLLEKEQLRFQWLLDNLLSGEYQVVDE